MVKPRDEGTRMKDEPMPRVLTILRLIGFTLVPSFFILFLCSGCAAIGAAAHAIPKYEPAHYNGLAGQSVGVMVWADRGIRIDWPSIQFDLASLVQDRLAKSGAQEIKGSSFPVQAGSIVRYQHDHPGIEAQPITEIAPKLGVSRLIYIELESLSTRSDISLQMYRGNALATLKVVEVAPDGSAKVPYEEAGVRAFFPPKSPPDGVLNSNDIVMYKGVVAALADEIVKRLTTHEVEDH
jgi:hypothetical protein